MRLQRNLLLVWQQAKAKDTACVVTNKKIVHTSHEQEVHVATNKKAVCAVKKAACAVANEKAAHTAQEQAMYVAADKQVAYLATK